MHTHWMNKRILCLKGICWESSALCTRIDSNSRTNLQSAWVKFCEWKDLLENTAAKATSRHEAKKNVWINFQLSLLTHTLLLQGFDTSYKYVCVFSIGLLNKNVHLENWVIFSLGSIYYWGTENNHGPYLIRKM